MAMKTYEEVLDSIRSRPRTWLVTGAAGFIGSHLLEKLLALDQIVIGLDNFSTGNRNNIKEAVGTRLRKRFNFIECDIRSLDQCRQACKSVDIVLHHAALGSVPLSIEDPIGAHANNVTGFLNMLVAAHGAGVSRFVYAGSCAIYGDDPALPKVESQIGQPLSPYAATKRVNEIYAETFARCYGLDSIGLRYFNVFGPRQDPGGAYAAVIPKWISSMIRNESVHINGDGETTRDFCYIDNVVQANILAATTGDPCAINQVYNVALGDRTSLNELFTIIQDLLERRSPGMCEPKPIYGEARAGDVRMSHADIGKAKRLLGYRPVWGVKQGLAKSIDWYLAKLMRHRARSTGMMPEILASVHGI